VFGEIVAGRVPFLDPVSTSAPGGLARVRSAVTDKAEPTPELIAGLLAEGVPG
jgi:hypothetical protein